jgi:hypothetical protein
MGSQSTMSSGVNDAAQSESTQVNGCVCVFTGIVAWCMRVRERETPLRAHTSNFVYVGGKLTWSQTLS